MSGLTILFMLFTVILYTYLILLRKEIVFLTKRKSSFSIFGPIAAAAIIGGLYISAETIEDKLRGFFGILMILSYVFNVRGIAEDRFVLQALDNRGIKFSEVDRVVVFQDIKDNSVKLNFFRRGLRGPLMRFKAPANEIVDFLSQRLNEGTPIDVIVNKTKSDPQK